jgi:hypothetical protein
MRMPIRESPVPCGTIGGAAVRRLKQNAPHPEGWKALRICFDRNRYPAPKWCKCQKAVFSVTNTCRGAPASRVWLSPLKPKPFEPIVAT